MLQLGNKEEAMKDFTKAIDVNSHYANAIYSRG